MTIDLKKRILEEQDITLIEPNLDILKILPRSIAEKVEAITFESNKKKIYILTTNNYTKQINQIVDRLSVKGYEVEYFYTDLNSFSIALKWYDILLDKEEREKREVEERENVTGENAIKMLQNLYNSKSKYLEGEFIEELIKYAFKAGSSDLHFQSEEMGVVLRIRKDGVMKTVLMFEHSEFKKYHIKLKFMSNVKLNIDHVPQDGRFDLVMKKGEEKIKIDVRVSFMPGLRSENIVMRFLDSSKGIMSFEQIGLMGDSLEMLKNNLSNNYGIILMTGPTGSGKTTTLYSMLNYLNSTERKIVTLEDPVEYELPGIQQSQINYNKGYSYEDGLKTVLRQDPDIIMIGEIRTFETAEIAINAALTGHLVISTLHTNTSIEAISRLLNMGVKPYLLASALNLIIGQRLLRKLCTCSISKKPKLAEEKEIENAINKINLIKPHYKLKLADKINYPGRCDKCGGEGYKGRIAVMEMFDLDDNLREIIINNGSILDLFSNARGNGFLSMKEDAYIKVLKGYTTLDEIRRVL